MTQLPRRPVDRRQSLLKKEPPACAHFAEVAGGTTAECVAVCCCCPCGLVNLLVLAVVKLPVGLCRRALKKKKKRRITGKKKPGLLQERKREDLVLSQVHPVPPKSSVPGALPHQLPKTDVSPMDDEAWVKLYTGFWRNPSERE
ncbi:uncharacterized protein LOC116248659 [Nymphaea colorata]|uniref:Uncharacterized protein n=1 Tax=Nymphaea colorata TaxID=210225 RepID=A0A5K1A565_9MAGN|nr:uncharacterized protein LOC116248659 [Nymphaea colorata]